MTRFISLFILKIFSLSVFDLYAEEQIDSVFISDFKMSMQDINYVGDEILHSSEQSLLKAGIIIGTSLLAMPFDEEARRISQRNVATLDGDVMSFANSYGDLLYPAIGTIGAYGLGLAMSDERLRTFSRKTCTSLLVAGVMTTLIKSIIGRSRPFTNQGSQTFTPFTINDARLSYPSGHTTVAFAMSASLSRYIDRWWADVILYGLASGTAYARMHHDRHWLSDTILGGAIGYFAAKWVFDADKQPSVSTSEALIEPTFTPVSMGFVIQF